MADEEGAVPPDNARLDPSWHNTSVASKNRNGTGQPRNRGKEDSTNRSCGGSGAMTTPGTDILDKIPRTFESNNHSSSRPSRVARDSNDTTRLAAPPPGGSQPRSDPSRGPPTSQYRNQNCRNHRNTGFSQQQQSTSDDNDMVGRWEFASVGEETTSSSVAAVSTGVTSPPVASSVATAASVVGQRIPKVKGRGGGGRLSVTASEAAGTRESHPPVARTGETGGANTLGTSERGGAGGSMVSASSRPVRRREEEKHGKQKTVANSISPVSNTTVTVAADPQDFSRSSPPPGRSDASRNEREGEDRGGMKRLRPETTSNCPEPRLESRGGLRRTQSFQEFEKKKKLRRDGLGGGRPPPNRSGCMSVGSGGGGDGRSGDMAVTQKEREGYDECNANATASTNTSTCEGFAGDVGRWQHGLGIAVGVEGSSAGDGSCDGRRSPPTASELMRDEALKEAFASRGRHKKTPVLAR